MRLNIATRLGHFEAQQNGILLRDLGKTEGELAAMKTRKPKGFWARLLGAGE